ncbi:angio-associated migratory cell protein [Microplitis demolitor]|uniref:angio-associated migratory cell protein n=1 Tax=Microplitis demolitor TaxID=69319 RepID=UPI0004CD4D11|nr:angio-associated migratory cell protein [Microplitis demolitor]
MFQKDSPPRSNEFDDFDENDMVYVDEIDEVIDLESDLQHDRMEEDELETDDAVTVFKHHKESVICGSLTNDGKIAVTGGQDDVAYIWNTESGEIIYKCTGHKDSIIFAEFSPDNSYVAAGDLSGIIQVWKMRDKSLVWSYNMGDASWMKWHNVANIIFAGSVEGEIYMWKIPSGECKVFQGYGHKTEAAAITSDGKKLVTGYKDGTIRVLDLKEGSVQTTIPGNSAHSDAITNLECQADGKLIISAAVDGRTVLSTTQNGKIVSILQNLQENKSAETNEDEADSSQENWPESVAFCRNLELHLAASGTINGELFIWDTSKQVIRHKITQERGITKLEWIANTPFLCTVGLDGIVRFYDARTKECLKELCGHSDTILDLHVCRNNTKILTTSEDCTARIFDVTDLQLK